MEEPKHIIAKLLEEVKRLQEIEPTKERQTMIDETIKYIKFQDKIDRIISYAESEFEE